MPNLRKQFSKIYDKYVDKIYRFIFLKVSSREAAEDLCSEVFVKTWDAYQRFNNPHPNTQSIENIQAFLYQVARNLVIDYYRERGRTKIVPAQDIQMSDPGISLEKQAILSSDLEVAKAALSKIKPEYETIIIWHYLDELSFSEIAQILGKSEGAVRIMLHRAKQALKRELLII